MYINNLGHMTKMAAMPINGKKPSNIFFSETNRLISMKLGVKHPWLKESGSTRPRVKSAWVSSAGSTRPGQVGLILRVMAKASGTEMRQCLYINLILTSYFRLSLPKHK